MRWNWSGDVVGGDFRSGEMQVIPGMSPLSIDFLKMMVTGVITAEEMLLGSLGRIVSSWSFVGSEFPKYLCNNLVMNNRY